MMIRHTALSANIVAFCRFLRKKGFTLSAEEEADALRSLEWIDYTYPDEMRDALRAVLCRSRRSLEAFDSLFHQYWKELERAVDSKIAHQEQPKPRPARQQEVFKSLKTWLNGNQEKEEELTAYYGLDENLNQRNFAAVPADEVDELMRVIRALSRRLAAHLNRRRQATRHQGRLDLRRTLRANLRRGGELLDLAWNKPKRNRTKLVVLCDVSQSMELYTSFLLQFLYAFQQVFRRVETFTFSTNLQRITPLLRERNYDEALRELSVQPLGWSGGTKIGHAFDTFFRDYAARFLDSRTSVIILSDGLDMGEADLVGDALARIRTRSRRIIWLNPLAGYAQYQPETAGMRAAWPHLDVFLPGHNVESLRKLARYLGE
ncbi:MAG: VWA domain-containing protein [Saprospiraceae bacterium]|nr:VWA domain-containing protein [Saprospiraceae bacterium]